MDRLTITLTVLNNSDAESFSDKATAALAHVVTLPEFREGTYRPGHTFQAPNGVTVRADYKIEEGVSA